MSYFIGLETGAQWRNMVACLHRSSAPISSKSRTVALVALPGSGDEWLSMIAKKATGVFGFVSTEADCRALKHNRCVSERGGYAVDDGNGRMPLDHEIALQVTHLRRAGMKQRALPQANKMLVNDVASFQKLIRIIRHPLDNIAARCRAVLTR